MKMSDKHAYVLAIVLALTAAILSCGNGDITGTGGNWGEGSTNTRVLLELNPDYIELDICNDVSVSVLANITTEQINSAMPANSLYLEGYEVAYKPDVVGSPDIVGDKYKLSSILPASDLNLFFIGPGIKMAFLNAINSGQYAGLPEFPSYAARYTAYGTDTFNGTPRVWGSRATFSFKMGRYSTCIPSMLPENIVVKAKLNPDGDIPPDDDNLTFNISGGTAPYTIISNSLLHIASPGVLSIGTTSFTVDPDTTGGIPASVTLTLTDAAGKTVVSKINLN
jgi:hypothetical protein